MAYAVAVVEEFGAVTALQKECLVVGHVGAVEVRMSYISLTVFGLSFEGKSQLASQLFDLG